MPPDRHGARPDHDPAIEPELRDWDVGHWRGRGLDDIAAEDPTGLHAWMTEPAAAPHGGEALVELLRRVERWLGAVPAGGHTVAVTPPRSYAP